VPLKLFEFAGCQFCQALRANPNHIRANELLAEMLVAQNRLDEACSLLEALLSTAPASARPRLVQVYLAQAQKAPDDQTCLELFEKVLGLDPHQPEARVGLDKINQLAQEEKDLAYRFVEGRQALQRGEWANARAALLWVTQTRPDYTYDQQLAADLLAESVRQGQTPPPRWKFWLRQSQNRAFLGGGLVLLVLLFVFGMGQQLVSFGAQGYGPFKNLATSTFTPTPTTTATFTPIATLTPTPTNTPPPTATLPPTATFTPVLAPGATAVAARADSMVMVYIPAGTFQMGSSNGSNNEQPVHNVSLDAFWMDQSEVTNAMYRKCVDAKACRLPDLSVYFGYPTFSNYPAVYVSWDGANVYCKWADAQLPSEAQWEYAARGGLVQNTYPWGNEAPSCEPGAKNGANYRSCNKNGPIAVKTFAPNDYGLYDMAGNVWEWVSDWYNGNYYNNSPAANPLGPANGTSRVMLGGAWNTDKYYLRVSNRGMDPPTDNPRSWIGFRCVRPK
jgi:formylglycine-generating enzyme required for sulfatase activity